MTQNSSSNAPGPDAAPQDTAPKNATPQIAAGNPKPAAQTPAQGHAPHQAHHPHQAHQAHPHYSAPKFPPAELIATLDNGTKVKRRVPRMRACDEKDEKGETCSGHLKRWFGGSREIVQRFGDELYVCERCRTIYQPNAQEAPRTGTLAW
jgi:hypothetical protein